MDTGTLAVLVVGTHSLTVLEVTTKAENARIQDQLQCWIKIQELSKRQSSDWSYLVIGHIRGVTLSEPTTHPGTVQYLLPIQALNLLPNTHPEDRYPTWGQQLQFNNTLQHNIR